MWKGLGIQNPGILSEGPACKDRDGDLGGGAVGRMGWDGKGAGLCLRF